MSPERDRPERLSAEVHILFNGYLGEHTASTVGFVRDGAARVIIDPGMGFFVGSNPEASLAVLGGLKRLLALGLPVLVSTSRKSFIGALLGGPADPRPADQRGAGTLATELWAVLHGAAYVRTHDVRAIRDALRLWSAIEEWAS